MPAKAGVKKITPEEHAAIQQVEAATWTPSGWTDPETGKEYKPYPSFEGKLAREREYQRQLLHLFRISGFRGVALDVGCGPSPATEQVDGNFLGIGVDPLIPSYAEYHNVFGWQRTLPCAAPAEHIPLPTALAHYVISTNALDHFQDPHAAFLEIARVIKPGGTFYLSFCIENASVGHPHPAHKIDLTTDDIRAWSQDLYEIEHQEIIEYGWKRKETGRGQAAALMILHRAPTIRSGTGETKDRIW